MLNLSAQDVLKPFTINQRTMTTLNSRLQLAMLNTEKGKKVAGKGLTLIELLITVVILGTLSSIALPAFLNQQDNAKMKAADADVLAAARSCAALQITGQHGSWAPPLTQQYPFRSPSCDS